MKNDCVCSGKGPSKTAKQIKTISINLHNKREAWSRQSPLQLFIFLFSFVFLSFIAYSTCSGFFTKNNSGKMFSDILLYLNT